MCLILQPQQRVEILLHEEWIVDEQPSVGTMCVETL
jgi:hypothetical protein